MINPKSYSGKYSSPHELAQDNSLSIGQKINCLKEWALDEELKMNAEEENMQNKELNYQNEKNNNLLSEILQELRSLGFESDIEHAPPHKFSRTETLIKKD